MNLNEDKKTPLREKDLNTKREMVNQYIFAASKTGSLKKSHQISPQEFLSELKSGVMDERLFACLDSLRVYLTSKPVRYRKKLVFKNCYFSLGAMCFVCFVILNFKRCWNSFKLWPLHFSTSFKFIQIFQLELFNED
ncbi:hypothetical protein ATANTOWER_010033 [Ataeniobius toweri]|uniref:Formin GTPase-binding domain-containing protein n=1 Tax=Ataeniobius toweri TaxID=208326 RepID=A0ABU7AYW1_9TELE|nr:hypothetical protein [Ataeniobius toweri]